MKHAAQEIILIAKQVMKDIDWGYDKNKEIEPLYKSKENQIKEYKDYKDHPNYEKITSEIKSFWTVGFDFEPEAEIEYNSMFLEIDDNTGEPYCIMHKQASLKISKDSNGKYFTVK